MGVFTMPSLGADMEAGTLVEWLVKPGDEVHRGDVLAVVETQKGAIEIECFEEGRVQELQADIGAKLPVGAPLALIVADGEPAPQEPAAAEPEPAPQEPEPAEPEPVEPAPAIAPVQVTEAPAAVPVAPSAGFPVPPVTAPPPSGALAVSPAARVAAKEKGIDLRTVKGTGPGGAILLKDLDAEPAPKPVPKASPQDEMRKAIAAAMTRAKQTIPHFYLSETIDIDPALAWLARRNESSPPAERVLPGALFVRAAAVAASKVSGMNGHFTDGAFRPSSRVNAGVAVALRGGGLVAPAVMGAEAMSVDDIMQAMRDLVVRARAGRLRSSEMTEGTITISSLGESGAEAMTGVIFPPQVALVGLGAPKLRPWVVDGAVVPRTVITLTLSADHRVSDGRQAARFIAEFKSQIASPEAL